VVATLARQDGRRVFPRNDFYRAVVASRIVEARYRLTTTAASDRTAAKRPTYAEQEKTARRGHAEPVRTTLRRQVRTAAAGATTIADFLERLRRDGVLVRERHSERDPDEITGYSVASPDSVDAEGKPVYHGGGRLATDLTGRAGCLNRRSSRKSQLSLDNELPRRVPCLKSAPADVPGTSCRLMSGLWGLRVLTHATPTR
jgi:hypothetical protein